MDNPDTKEKRTFSHKTLHGALKALKSEMGDDALIIHTRQVKKKGVLGLGQQSYFEIEACPSRVPKDQDDTHAPRKSWIEKTYGLTKSRPGLNELPDKTVPSPMAPVSASDDLSLITSEMRQLKEMISEMVLRGRESDRLSGLSEELQELYRSMLKQGIDERRSRELVLELNNELKGVDLVNPKRLREELRQKLSERFNVSPPLHTQHSRGQTRVAAFIGPTGVGKTTTISKLAGYCHHYERQKVGLLTLDTYRIAASDQLQRVAEIVDVPIKIETSPQGLRRSLDQFAGRDLIMIDTAGRSQRDVLHMNELKKFLEVAEPDEVHLVVPVNLDSASLEHIFDSFGPMATHLCLTKLDEARRLGPLVEHLIKSELKMCYWTFGQSIPDDIATVDTRRLARLLLGEESL